jgi:hypothetical protein
VTATFELITKFVSLLFKLTEVSQNSPNQLDERFSREQVQRRVAVWRRMMEVSLVLEQSEEFKF